MFAVEGVQEFALVRDFAIIMAVAGAAVVIFRRLNQPPILGYLLAGVLIGPFTFPNPPVANQDSIRLLADLGLVLLLFALGLEFGWRRIRQVGLGVLLIGTVELLVMVSLGYQTGRWLGWTTLESVFLGAALSISSSAILVKVLRDTGRLSSTAGRLIVGILVVEDFIAVILLTLLSGVATTGAASIGDVGPLVYKLGIFAVASLTLGGIFVPRIIEFVAKYRSDETMLLASLAMCFSLALIAQSLGMSAAAGAFLIGAVIGDTEHSHQIERIIIPVRDMFGALFFVSIGMLVNVYEIQDQIVPAVIITVVFVSGKIAADTVGTFVSGQSGRVPLQVGMGMPQVGEFSLAMVKIGSEQNVIGPFVYQVVVAVTAINSAVYPYIARYHQQVGDFLDRVSPGLFKRYLENMSLGIQAFHRGLSFDNDFAHRVRGSVLSILINSLIIVVLMAVGTFAISFSGQIGSLIAVPQEIVGSAIGFVTLALCFPSVIAIWRSLHHLADETTAHFILRRATGAVWVQSSLRNVIRDSVMIFLLILVGLWSIPFVGELLSLGGFAVPVPFLVLSALVFAAIRTLTRIHSQLVDTFSKTFLGEGEEPEGDAAAVLHDEPAPAEPAMAVEPLGRDNGVSTATEVAVAQPIVQQVTRSEVSLGEAEIIALTAARNDQSLYQRRLGEREIVWDIHSSTEADGYYRIVLDFRPAAAPRNDLGEEEFYIDNSGDVLVRQVRSWPQSTVRRMPSVLMYVGVLVIVSTIVGLGAFAFALNTGGKPLVSVAEASSGPNTPPIAADDSYRVAGGGTLIVGPNQGVLRNDGDEDGDELSVRVVSGTSSGLLAMAPDGSFRYEPDLDFAGTDSFTYRADDGTSESVEVTATVSVGAR